MRHTNLIYRSPVERTPDFRVTQVTKYGTNLNYCKPPHVRKSSFSKEVRFKKPQLYCNQTGESAFVGPGAYEDLSSFLILNSQPCGVKMRQSSILSKNCDTSNVYSLIGQNLKYNPGFDYPNSKHQKLLCQINLHDCPVNAEEAISISKLKNIRKNLKNQRKSAFLMGLVEHSTLMNNISETKKPEQLINEKMCEEAKRCDLPKAQERYNKFLKQCSKF